MAPGAVNQEIYVPGLPEGIKLLLTEVTFSIPEGQWWPTLSTSRGTITKNTTPEQMHQILPVEISPSVESGKIGTAGLTSQSVFDTGKGPEIYLKFQLNGTTVVNGQSLVLDNVYGNITISTTEWTLSERPDYCNISYLIAGQPPQNFANKVPFLTTPDPLLFAMGVSPDEGKRIGINASLQTDVIKELMQHLLDGVFFAHGEAFGWVIGKL